MHCWFGLDIGFDDNGKKKKYGILPGLSVYTRINQYLLMNTCHRLYVFDLSAGEQRSVKEKAEKIDE